MATKASIQKKVRRVKLEKMEGYLFAKLHAIGSKSEGPLYYLQLKTGKEILVMKKAEPWENDPVLQARLGEKVVVFGRYCKVENNKDFSYGMDYTKVMNADDPLTLNFKLNIKGDILWINKMPGPQPVFPPLMKNITMSLLVECAPYLKKKWEGKCPTSQYYDFWIEDPAGRTIWNWGNGMFFKDKTTKVTVTFGTSPSVKVPWYYFDDSITREGLYVARARFIASGQEVRKPFWVKFAR